MYKMSRDQWWEFVTAGTKTGKLAVVRKDGAPQVVPIWFLLDTDGEHDYVVFTTADVTVKGRALSRDPRFSLCVDEEAPPFSFVSIQAEAELSDDMAELLKWATKLGGRYMGAAAAEAFGRRNAVPGELLVRGRITKVIAQAEIAN